jgi:hypothetical protein
MTSSDVAFAWIALAGLAGWAGGACGGSLRAAPDDGGAGATPADDGGVAIAPPPRASAQAPASATGRPAGGPSCPAVCARDADCQACAGSAPHGPLCCEPVGRQCYESVQATCNLAGPAAPSSSSPGAPAPVPTLASDAAPGPAPSDAAAPDRCATAVHVALGSSVSGTTCGGVHVGSSLCQEGSNPDAFIYVDAPDGTALHLTASPGLSILAYPTCQSDRSLQCTFSAATFDPTDARGRLFAVERIDTTCGVFTVGVTAN